MASDDLLDKLTAEYLDNMAQILELSQFLEKYIGDGRLNLSKARYHLGSHDRVSSVYYNEAALSSAQMQVSTEEDTLPSGDSGDAGVSWPHFFLVNTAQDKTTSVSKPEERKDEEEKQTKKNNSAGEEEPQSPTPDTTTTDEKSKPPVQPSPPTNDPLNWFGILVPQSLRSAQQDFKRCLPILCELASRRAKLVALRGHIRSLVEGRLAVVQDGPLRTSLLLTSE